MSATLQPRRLVYGRPDPAPGNFAPRFGTTDEFVALASEEAGRDLKWFFGVYIRSAKLPVLVEQRRPTGSTCNGGPRAVCPSRCR